MAGIKFSQFIGGNEIQVGDEVVGLRDGQNYQFNFPANGIKDADGNFLYGYSTIGSLAVNYPSMKNASTLNSVVYGASGNDADISITIMPKGAGVIGMPAAVNGITQLTAGNINLQSNNITSVNTNGNINLTPNGTGIVSVPAPVNNSSAATKLYVDSLLQAQTLQPVGYATTGILLGTYNNGTSGIGATLTNYGALAPISIDGVFPAVGETILVKDQSTTFQNGVYEVTVAGDGITAWVLTRSTSYDETYQIMQGTAVLVTGGTANISTSWYETEVVNNIGADPILFVEFTVNPSDIMTLSASQTVAGDKTFNGLVIVPTPLTGTEAANKDYVDGLLGMSPVSAEYATASALTAIYDNGAAGIGATLTNSGIFAALSIDGFVVTVGQNILVKNQVAAFENGVYVVTDTGDGVTPWVLTRVAGFDQLNEIVAGLTVVILSGATNERTSWVETQVINIIGTDPILFELFTLNPVDIVTLANPQTITGAKTFTSLLTAGNIGVSSNTIASINANGDIDLSPNGVGNVNINSNNLNVASSIRHIGDITNQHVFGSATQNFQTSGVSRVDITDSGVRFGGANARVTTIFNDSTMAGALGTTLSTGLATKTYIDNKAAVKADMEAATSTSVYVTPAVAQNHPSATKAWGYITYSAGTPTLQTGYNIASIVDGGLGILTVNFTTPMSSAIYPVIATQVPNSRLRSGINVTNRLATSFNLNFYSADNLDDPIECSFSVFGDQ